MSATNRGGKRSPADFYATPAWAVRRLLQRLAIPGGRWLEPAAGTGSIIRAANAVRSDVEWAAIEMREECRADLNATGAAVTIADFLAAPTCFDPGCAVAILNPPFSLAHAFVKRCLDLCPWVIALERSTWIGDEANRHAFFSGCMPDEYRIGRVDFDGRGGDASTYSWFVWEPGMRERVRAFYELLPRGDGEQLALDGAA